MLHWTRAIAPPMTHFRLCDMLFPNRKQLGDPIIPKFQFIYHGCKTPETPEEAEKVLAAWMAWIGGAGTAIIEPGNPVGMSKTLTAAGVTNDGGANPASGHAMVDVADMDAAIAIGPIRTDGRSVEVAQVHEMQRSI